MFRILGGSRLVGKSKHLRPISLAESVCSFVCAFVGNCILEKGNPSDVQILAWQFAKLGSETEFGLPAARLQLSVGQVPKNTRTHEASLRVHIDGGPWI